MSSTIENKILCQFSVKLITIKCKYKLHVILRKYHVHFGISVWQGSGHATPRACVNWKLRHQNYGDHYGGNFRRSYMIIKGNRWRTSHSVVIFKVCCDSPRNPSRRAKAMSSLGKSTSRSLVISKCVVIHQGIPQGEQRRCRQRANDSALKVIWGISNRIRFCRYSGQIPQE